VGGTTLKGKNNHMKEDSVDRGGANISKMSLINQVLPQKLPAVDIKYKTANGG
jgi:hypothetical protein